MQFCILLCKFVIKVYVCMCVHNKRQNYKMEKPFIFLFFILFVGFIVARSNYRHMYIVNVWDSVPRAESSGRMLHSLVWRSKI